MLETLETTIGGVIYTKLDYSPLEAIKIFSLHNEYVSDDNPQSLEKLEELKNAELFKVFADGEPLDSVLKLETHFKNRLPELAQVRLFAFYTGLQPLFLGQEAIISFGNGIFANDKK